MTRREAAAEDAVRMRTTEQMAGMVVGIAAIVLAVLALLRGFAAFTWGTAPEAPVSDNFGSGMMWMIPAITLSILAVVLARADHRHNTRDRAQTLHVAAYAGAVVAIVLAALGLLTAFDWIGADTTATTGMLWGSASIVAAFITLGLHIAVPTTVTDEDYLVSLVESRVQPRPAGGPAAPAPEREPRA